MLTRASAKRENVGSLDALCPAPSQQAKCNVAMFCPEKWSKCGPLDLTTSPLQPHPRPGPCGDPDRPGLSLKVQAQRCVPGRQRAPMPALPRGTGPSPHRPGARSPGSGGPWASASKGVVVAGAALWAGARAAGSGCPVGMPPSRPADLSLMPLACYAKRTAL